MTIFFFFRVSNIAFHYNFYLSMYLMILNILTLWFLQIVLLPKIIKMANPLIYWAY